MRPEAQVRRIAARQSGLITREQLRSCGLTDKQIHKRTEAGGFVRVLRGVFRLGGVPLAFESRLVAVSLWLGADGYFFGQTAAHILKLDGIRRPDRIGVARHMLKSHPPWIYFHRLDPTDRPALRRVDGHKVCRTERVLAECCGEMSPDEVGRALDDALRRRLSTLDRVRAFTNEWAGRKGVRVLRQLCEERDDGHSRVRSAFESKMLTLLRRFRGHRFVPDFELRVGDRRYFLDFYCPELQLGIECHSYKWHIGMHNEDARRDRQIGAAGIDILYFTWDDVRLDSTGVLRDIQAAVDRRCKQLQLP